MQASWNEVLVPLLKSEHGGCAASGMKPPEVDSELTSYGDNGFLAMRPGSLGSFCQDSESLLHRVILGLIAHHAPRQLDQSGAQPAISMPCDGTGPPVWPPSYIRPDRGPCNWRPGCRLLKRCQSQISRLMTTLLNAPMPLGSAAGAAFSNSIVRVRIC